MSRAAKTGSPRLGQRIRAQGSGRLSSSQAVGVRCDVRGQLCGVVYPECGVAVPRVHTVRYAWVPGWYTAVCTYAQVTSAAARAGGRRRNRSGGKSPSLAVPASIRGGHPFCTSPCSCSRARGEEGSRSPTVEAREEDAGLAQLGWARPSTDDLDEASDKERSRGRPPSSDESKASI